MSARKSHGSADINIHENYKHSLTNTPKFICVLFLWKYARRNGSKLYATHDKYLRAFYGVNKHLRPEKTQSKQMLHVAFANSGTMDTGSTGFR